MMFRLVVSAGFWLTSSALFLPRLTDSSDVVDLSYAKYLGNRTYPNSVAYLGIPYAEPPIGNLRYRAPLPLNTSRVAEESGGTAFDATTYPDTCIQGSVGAPGNIDGTGSEDCLKLNIYAPAGAKEGDKLPVLFYIHGGAYIFGNPSNWPFDRWIHQSPNVVIISVYYRLGALGFLTSPEFIDDSELGDLNAGFQDQIQGLKWVNKYISAFGGDPSKVTINGESAGGTSTELHLVTDEGNTLFSKAIVQSVYRVPVPMPDQQKDLFNDYVQHAGCGTGQISSQMECLRSANMSTLTAAQDHATQNFTGPYNGFHPVVDGKIIKDYPTRLIYQGKFARVPLIVGATSNETMALGPNITTALQTYWPAFTNSDVDELTNLYPLDDFESAAQQQLVLTGDASLRCARTIMADAYSSVATSWAYRYNQPNPMDGTPDLVSHGDELFFMFFGINSGPTGVTTYTPLSPVQTAFTEELVAYWLSFVRAGDPNTYKLSRSPMWSGYSVNNPVRVVLSQNPKNITAESGSVMELTPDVESLRCRFLATKVSDEQA